MLMIMMIMKVIDDDNNVGAKTVDGHQHHHRHPPNPPPSPWPSPLLHLGSNHTSTPAPLPNLPPTSWVQRGLGRTCGRSLSTCSNQCSTHTHTHTHTHTFIYIFIESGSQVSPCNRVVPMVTTSTKCLGYQIVLLEHKNHTTQHLTQ